ncbi:ATP-binding protein [Leadbettera azotonutricia]|uniref:ATPase n=1 Tax=Leadbettera azotonutricia (strain ATCC BAA-888 / DSM 13862 / ZAS-9) TaxID=545695 RepID=F5YB25_LEAAZ|nr:ATP-binding protein [Leadbettera azotonutricia]AEF83054.1 ATPase [Leadbettera azotonutricia ZAS-9]
MDNTFCISRDDFIKKIRPFIGKNIVKILSGIRRCGKSVMLRLIQQELLVNGVENANILAMNFDTFEDNTSQSPEALYAIIKQKAQAAKGKVYVFLDEIQVLPGWEKLVNSCFTELNADIYVSGSNSQMLSPEYATYLGGRYVMFTVYPFSFKEAVSAFKLYGKNLAPKEAFAHYLVYGGMPFIYQLNFDDFSIRQYLRDIADSILLKDITARYNIRDVELLKRIILFLFSNIGNMFSTVSIQNYLKRDKRNLSWETIHNYIDHCKTACLLLPVKQESISGKQLLKAAEKIYITDHGLREAIYGNNRNDISQVLENIVYLELLRNDYNVTVGKAGLNEIDFIARKNNETVYIQVAYLLASPETIEREFSVYARVTDNFPKYVLSLDEFDMSRNGIKHINIVDFLTSGQGVYI